MRGLLGLLFAFALAAIGCQSPPQAMDPFLRTTVPPPATGQVGPVPTGAYGAPPPGAQALLMRRRAETSIMAVLR